MKWNIWATRPFRIQFQQQGYHQKNNRFVDSPSLVQLFLNRYFHIEHFRNTRSTTLNWRIQALNVIKKFDAWIDTLPAQSIHTRIGKSGGIGIGIGGGINGLRNGSYFHFRNKWNSSPFIVHTCQRQSSRAYSNHVTQQITSNMNGMNFGFLYSTLHLESSLLSEEKPSPSSSSPYQLEKPKILFQKKKNLNSISKSSFISSVLMSMTKIFPVPKADGFGEFLVGFDKFDENKYNEEEEDDDIINNDLKKNANVSSMDIEPKRDVHKKDSENELEEVTESASIFDLLCFEKKESETMENDEEHHSDGNVMDTEKKEESSLPVAIESSANIPSIPPPPLVTMYDLNAEKKVNETDDKIGKVLWNSSESMSIISHEEIPPLTSFQLKLNLPSLGSTLPLGPLTPQVIEQFKKRTELLNLHLTNMILMLEETMNLTSSMSCTAIMDIEDNYHPCFTEELMLNIYPNQNQPQHHHDNNENDNDVEFKVKLLSTLNEISGDLGSWKITTHIQDDDGNSYESVKEEKNVSKYSSCIQMNEMDKENIQEMDQDKNSILSLLETIEFALQRLPSFPKKKSLNS